MEKSGSVLFCPFVSFVRLKSYKYLRLDSQLRLCINAICRGLPEQATERLILWSSANTRCAVSALT